MIVGVNRSKHLFERFQMWGECGMNVLSSKAPSPLGLGGWQPNEHASTTLL